MTEKTTEQLYMSQSEAGKRLDVVLAALLEDSSRSYLTKQIEDGNVFVNGEVCAKKKTIVKEGDCVELHLEPPKELDASPEEMDLSIVYEDDDLLVVNKPAGLCVHPAPGNLSGTLVNGLLYHCKGRLSSINGVIRPGIVHRIDKDTSGLLVVAKTDVAHRGLSEQLEKHSMERAYRAIVVGNLKEDEGVIAKPLGRDPKNRLRYACVKPGNGKEAVTHWRVLERLSGYTLVECRLETGRTHQIRVHMADSGHPLIGDPLYGFTDKSGAKRQMLHAYLLGFEHPVTKETLRFEAPLPEDFEAVLEKLRKQK